MNALSALSLAVALLVVARAPTAVVVAEDSVRVEYAPSFDGNRYADGGEPFGEDRLVCEVAEVDRALELTFEAMRDYGIDTKVTLVRTDEGRTRAEVSAVRRLPSNGGHGTDITEVADLHGVVRLARPDWSPGHDVRLEFEVLGTLDGSPVKLRGGWSVRNDTNSAGASKDGWSARPRRLENFSAPQASDLHLGEPLAERAPDTLAGLRWYASPMSLSLDATNRWLGEDMNPSVVGFRITALEPGTFEFDVCDARLCDGRFARFTVHSERREQFVTLALKPGTRPTTEWILWDEDGLGIALDGDVPSWARPARDDSPVPMANYVVPRWSPANNGCGHALTSAKSRGEELTAAELEPRILHVFSWNGDRSDEIARRLLEPDAHRTTPVEDDITANPLFTTPIAQWPEPVWIVQMRWKPHAK